MRAWVWRRRLAAAGLALLIGAAAHADERSSGGGGGAIPLPYTGYKYQLQWKSGHYAAGFTTLTPVLVTSGSPKGQYVSLENGAVGDADFFKWVKNTNAEGAGAKPLEDIRMEVRGSEGQLTAAYSYNSCRAYRYQALPVLNYKGTGIPMQELMLLCAPKKA
jgi:hypothetical protein